MKTLYEATTLATGGRKGKVKSEDGPLDFNLSVPKSMGGSGGDGANPEQFFGAAYAACFGGAIQAVAENEKIKIDNDKLSVTAIIGFCKDDDGFFLEATLDCYIPGVDVKTGEDLVEKAHEICPFSKATRDNITVRLNLLLDE
ncbi:organic hydroperoxide resistance protein [Algibacter amylolyticus]|uniref:Organic hydroperoxide resistance protein n=1 Tax=Algibacter amylolyticus TaxID=1608400 RepID=A0A5M7AT25_9FLAO|nr:organic hydroperoxide resistance protein [Algibacter amylolyticus]KAA5820569.1 organic hydroperoxide resistance protein [Algibacter amylolyticus]MBB5269972.1 Ohr subfamily peroxiredoxin [Algibacter amylolyticus]TSJ71242.1 organic hydroperoxide resistance protein [Algibacter amylolyticus]